MSRGWLEVERKILHLLHGRKTRTLLPQIHAHFLRHNLHQSNQVLAHFVSVCGALSKMDYADRIFCQTQNPNIFLFNSMIKGYSLNGPFQDSLFLFSLMKSRGIWPDEYTFAPLLKSSSNLCDFKLGQCVHAEIITVGYECYGSIRIGIVELYTTCGQIEGAMKVFDQMCHRDVIVWNLMIRGFCKRGDVDMGLCLFRQMSERSVVSWNVMISCLAQRGRDNEGLGLFVEMRDQGFKPDETTIVTVLPICARLGDVGIGQWIHSYAKLSMLVPDFVSVGNALMDFYFKCGLVEIASQLFEELPQKNVVSWNTMISGLAFNGNGELGIEMFEDMMSKGIRPNDATLLGALTCCAHAGLVNKGRMLFASMTLNHHINPKLEHYGCMVDLLGRSGGVKEAYDLVRSMPMRPNSTLWGALLSACRTHRDLQLAELAVKELINLEPQNSGNYVVLSNIYAEEGRWGEVEKVRALMRENSVKKAPGRSAVGAFG